MANLLVLGRQFNDAKQHLDLLAQKQPQQPRRLSSPAPITTPAINNTTAALADMQTAKRLGPDRSDTYLNLAILEMHGEQWDAAEADFMNAAKLAPKSTECAGLAGQLLPEPRAISRGGAVVPAGHCGRSGRSQPQAFPGQPVHGREQARPSRGISAPIEKGFPRTIPWATACSAISIFRTTRSTRPPTSMPRYIATIRRTWWSRRITFNC